MSSKFGFILVKPQLGENIGACARAMKNFGFSKLHIVEPKINFPNHKAKATSVGAFDIINKAKGHKKSVGVVGTSTVRTLETVVVSGFQITARKGWTDKFIYPPYDFKMCDKFITNLHQPQSTLMMLTAAFAKKDFILHAYEEAIKKKYRFHSYGDSMIII